MSEAGSDASTVEQSRTIRIDPHLHTAASYDGYTTPEQLVDRAEAVGLDAVVVTDHDTVEGARAVERLAVDRDLVPIRGCEVSTAEGHLLAIGIEEAPAPGRRLAATARTVTDRGGVAVVPHPFQRSRHGAGRGAIADVDGIEVYNAHALTHLRNRQAERFAARRDYPAFGGSDAHRPSGIGRAATAIELPPTAAREPIPTADAILEGMRVGRTAAVQRRSNRWHSLAKLLDSATRKTLSVL